MRENFSNKKFCSRDISLALYLFNKSGPKSYGFGHVLSLVPIGKNGSKFCGSGHVLGLVHTGKNGTVLYVLKYQAPIFIALSLEL